MAFMCVSCVHDTAWNHLPRLPKCHSLDGATLLLPAEATAATRRQYLALSKACRSCGGIRSTCHIDTCDIDEAGWWCFFSWFRCWRRLKSRLQHWCHSCARKPRNWGRKKSATPSAEFTSVLICFLSFAFSWNCFYFIHHFACVTVLH